MTSPDPQRLRAFHDEGVTVIPEVLPREHALGLRSILQACIEEDLARWSRTPGYIDQNMVHNLMVRHDTFLALLENPVLHAYLSDILGETCILYAYTSSTMPPGGSNYSRRIHVDSPRVIPDYVTNVGITLALDDFTEQNGAIEFLPGSQWRTTAPDEAAFEQAKRALLLRAGEAALFNARTWHRGGLNQTSAPRHAVTMNVCRSFMRQRFDYPRLVPSHLVERLGPVGRRFLGFNVRVPASLEEYYVPPEHRLYLPNQG